MPGRVGSSRFAEAVLRTVRGLGSHLDIAGVWGDPAGFTGGDAEGGELAWMDAVSQHLGVPIWPTETNELDPRLEAVRDELTYLIDGRLPGLIISSTCKVLRKGFVSNYRYKRERVAGSERTSDKPEKNDYSHLQDALQYWLLGKKGRHNVISMGRGSSRAALSSPKTGCVTIRSNVNLFKR
jgi:hypothetical protein